MAHALKFHAVVRGKTLNLPDLSAFEGKQVEVTVVEEESSGLPTMTVPASRPLGLLRDRWVVPENINDPLPPEIQKYFEGGDGDE